MVALYCDHGICILGSERLYALVTVGHEHGGLLALVRAALWSGVFMLLQGASDHGDGGGDLVGERSPTPGCCRPLPCRRALQQDYHFVPVRGILDNGGFGSWL